MGCNNSKRNDENYRKNDEISEMMLSTVKITINQPLAEGQSREAEVLSQRKGQVATGSDFNITAQLPSNTAMQGIFDRTNSHFFYILNSGNTSREVSFPTFIPTVAKTVPDSLTINCEVHVQKLRDYIDRVMRENECELFDIRKVKLITEESNQILTVDTDNKVIFKFYGEDTNIDDTSIFLRVLFSKPTFSKQVMILWINLQTFLPLGRGRVDERSSPSSNNGLNSNEGPNGSSNQLFSCSPDPQTNRTFDYPAGPGNGQKSTTLPAISPNQAGMPPGQVNAAQEQMAIASRQMNAASSPGQMRVAPNQMGVASLQVDGNETQDTSTTASPLNWLKGVLVDLGTHKINHVFHEHGGDNPVTIFLAGGPSGSITNIINKKPKEPEDEDGKVYAVIGNSELKFSVIGI